jgi:hypothetical protein
MPELEDEQRPEQLAVVLATSLVLVEQPPHVGGIEDPLFSEAPL